jgi:predicted dienelactone hydrolase
MKWLKRTLAVLLLLVAGVAGVAVATALKAGRPVGFQVVQIADGAGGSIPAGIWYPTTGSPRPTTLIGMRLMDVAPNGPVNGSRLPLILISHGNGGGPGSHADLAMALAATGYVVAAPMHAGDNYMDGSGLATPNWLASRGRDLRLTTDYLLGAWSGHDRIDASRIGAFGFSAGGYTVLAAIGAQPDLRLIPEHCAKQPEFVCAMLRQAKSPLLSPLLQASAAIPASQPDPRIKAAVVAAPGLGFTMAGSALAGVKAPVQLWSAADDTTVPYDSNARVVREGMAQGVEFHLVPRAGHMAFLVPCGPIGPPALCKDAEGFDRTFFHAHMNKSVIDFFNRQL